MCFKEGLFFKCLEILMHKRTTHSLTQRHTHTETQPSPHPLPHILLCTQGHMVRSPTVSYWITEANVVWLTEQGGHSQAQPSHRHSPLRSHSIETQSQHPPQARCISTHNGPQYTCVCVHACDSKCILIFVGKGRPMQGNQQNIIEYLGTAHTASDLSASPG